MDPSEVDREQLLKQDDIQDHILAKQRDHNISTLTSLLHIGSESLVKTKVKEHVIQYSSQFDLMKMKETKEYLKETINNLCAQKQNLQQQVELESVNRCQLENTLHNTEKIKNMFLEHYEKLQSSYESEQRNIEESKTTYKEQLENYLLQKENILKQINEKKAAIDGFQDYNKLELLRHETEVNERVCKLTEISEIVSKTEIAMETVKAQLEVLKTKYETNNIIVIGLNQNSQSTQNSINNYSSLINDLEAKLIKDKGNNYLLLKKGTDELDGCTKILAELENKEVVLEELCIQESNKSKDLDEALSKLNDETAQLELEKQQATESENNVINELDGLQLTLSSQRNSVQSKKKELQERVNAIILSKENNLEKAQWGQQKNQEAEEKLEELQKIKTKLANENLANAVKVEWLSNREVDIKEKIDVLKTSLAVIQEKQLQEEINNKKLNSDLDCKLLLAESELQEVTNHCETTLKNFESERTNYKYQHQLVDKQNQEDAEKALEELSSEVAKLKSDYEKKFKRLNETKQLIIKKNEFFEKSLKDLIDMRKKDSRSFQEPVTPTRIKPVGILKSPGKTGVSPKKVKFDVLKDSVTESESETFSVSLLI